MQEFKIKLLDTVYTEGFDFNQDPAIELVLNDQDKAIYEKPFFDFTAYGQLYQDIKDYMQNTSFCDILDMCVYKNNELLWQGSLDLGQTKNFFSTTDKGCYSENEIIDLNFNRWFKTFENVKVNLINPFTLDCEPTEVPQLQDLSMFIPSAPGFDLDRKAYLVFDVFEHVVNIITRGNVQFQSDFFGPGGECENLMIMNGSMIRLDPLTSCQQFTEVSWSELFENIGKYFNLWAQFYESGGQQFVKVEPFEDFIDESSRFDFTDVSNVEQSAKFDKLYATVKIGDAQQVDETSFTPVFVPFDYDDFSEQIIDVSQECSTEAELNLQSDFIVDTDKINFALVDIDNTYDNDIFLIETDGTAALEFPQETFNYYNDKMINGNTVKRYFNGLNPQSLFPENFANLDYFNAQACIDPEAVPGNLVTSGALPGLPTSLNIFDFRALFDLVKYDTNNALSEPTYTASTNLASLIGRPYTEFTCVTAGSYNFQANMNLGLTGGTSTTDTFEMNVNIDHRTGGGALIARYSSPFEVVNFGSITKINLQAPSFTMAVGEKAYVRLLSNTVSVATGIVNYIVFPGSTFSVEGCSNFISEYKEDLKNLIFQTSHSDFPISEADFQTLRDNPTQIIRTISGDTYIDAFIERLRYNYINCATDAQLQGSKLFKDRF